MAIRDEPGQGGVTVREELRQREEVPFGGPGLHHALKQRRVPQSCAFEPQRASLPREELEQVLGAYNRQVPRSEEPRASSMPQRDGALQRYRGDGQQG